MADGGSLLITKQLAIAEDINFGMGTVEQERLGATATYEQVNASHIPFSTTQSLTEKLVSLESGSNLSLAYAWDSEAQKRTAASYAIEPENIEVKVYTSNGDGSFSVVAQTGVHSSLHWRNQTENELDLQNWEADASVLTAASYAQETTDVIVWTSNGDSTFTQTVQTGVSSAKTLSDLAGTHATNAELFMWEAQAWQLTANSYAVEADDVLVNLVTSDSDGTFTYTPIADTYSALHHKNKAEAFAISIDPAGFMEQDGIVFTGDVDTLLDTGSFYISNTATNIPTADFYTLLVAGNESDGVSQVAISLVGIPYNRAYNGTVWSAWKQIDGALDHDDYASSDGTVGGTVKARLDGTNLYLTFDGTDA